MSQATIAPLLRGNTLGNLQSSFVLAEWQDNGGVEDGPPRLIAPLLLFVEFKDFFFGLYK
jgi:hypothetical protein